MSETETKLRETIDRMTKLDLAAALVVIEKQKRELQAEIDKQKIEIKSFCETMNEYEAEKKQLTADNERMKHLISIGNERIKNFEADKAELLEGLKGAEKAIRKAIPFTEVGDDEDSIFIGKWLGEIEQLIAKHKA